MRIFQVLALTLMWVVPLAATAQELAAPTGTISTQQTAQIDADIAVRIREILGELGNYGDVTVTVSDGVVTLRGTATSLAEVQALDTLVTRIEGVVAIRNTVTETTDIIRRLDPAIERFKARVEKLLIQSPLLLIALVVFLAVTWAGNILAGWKNPWNRLAPNAFIADLIRTLIRIVFLIAAIVIALDILNATALLSTILGAAGLIGLAIGFAVRDTVENFIASVMLSIRQPFRPNDVVEINGDQGKVIRLTSRATILLSFDGNHIRIPNATVFKSRIINFSQNRERRFQFTITVAIKSDLGRARSLAVETTQALPFVLEEPAASAWIGEFTSSGVEIVVVGWIDQIETSIVLARGETLRLVKQAIERAGIDIPDSTYNVRLESHDLADVPTRTPKTAPVATETVVVAQVDADGDTALDRLINAERDDDTVEDLLREDAAKE